MTLAAVAAHVMRAGAPTKADLPWLKLARFGDARSEKGSLRHDANVIAVTGVEIDYDGEVVGFEAACEWVRQKRVRALAYTSPSHSEDKPRWRILFPASTELPPTRRAQLVARANGILGGVAAPESFAISQAYYLGAPADCPPPRVDIIDGDPIDLRDDLDASAIGKSEKAPTATINANAGGATVIPLWGQPPAIASTRPSAMIAAAQAGMTEGRHWVDDLPIDQLCEMTDAILSDPSVIARADLSRHENGGWRNMVWAIRDLGNHGLPDAKERARKWAQTSAKYTDEGFETVWRSMPAPGHRAIGLGTLIALADDLGIDLSRWREAATVQPKPNHDGPFFTPIPFDAPNLWPVSWLVSGLLLRGEITVLAGQGGGAKTAIAVALGVTLAAGRSTFGLFRVDGGADGLRVGCVSAEEDRARIGLLVAAAADVAALDPMGRMRAARNLRFHDAQVSRWRLGEPRPGMREEMSPERYDRALAALEAAAGDLDVLILDTMAALFALPNENDNPAVTTLMRRLSGMARRTGCAVLLIHHTPKMTREAAAAQRGEATLVRGGGAITNSARVVLSLTALPEPEAVQFVMHGLQGDRIRRLEHVKINDMPPMAPAYVNLLSAAVKVHDGSKHAVRAVEFITPPAAGSVPNAYRNIAMKAIDAGVTDKHGAHVPLSRGGAGRKNERDATTVVGRALMGAATLTEPQAQTLAKAVLHDLIDVIGCVVVQAVQVPKYKADGQPNGKQERQGLVCRWGLAPWATQPKSEPTDADPGATAPSGGGE